MFATKFKQYKMETVALNDLWQYIQTLHLTSQNRQWLVDKLLSNNGQQPKGLSYDMLSERLDSLSSLPADWDDEGALPINKMVVKNVRTLLDSAEESNLAHWNLFPAVNGTLTLQHDSVDALLSVGIHDYSFVFASGGRIVKAVDNAPFSVLDILELMKITKGQKYA